MIRPGERLIVALDVPTPKQARALVEKLGDAVRFYKIGLELFTADGYFELLAWLTGRGNKVFADLKLYDIPETVRRAVANLNSSGATFLTVHGHRSVMEAAAREKGAMKILAVTVLTSFDERDLKEMGSTQSVEQLVLAAGQGRGRERLRRRDLLGPGSEGAEGAVQEAPAGGHARHPAGEQRPATIRSAPWTWRRRSPTAPITSSSAGRSGTRPIRARRPRRSRARSKQIFTT